MKDQSTSINKINEENTQCKLEIYNEEELPNNSYKQRVLESENFLENDKEILMKEKLKVCQKLIVYLKYIATFLNV